MKGSSDSAAVDRYLSRLRRRAWTVHALRAVVFGSGVGAFAFALAATGVGPVTGGAGAVAAWVGVGLLTAAAVVGCLYPVGRLRGARAARLLDREDPALVSATRSAVELAHDARAGALAPAMVRAHRARVDEALVQVPPARVVPWSAVRHPTLVLGPLGLALAAVLLAGVDRTAAGAYAIFHPDTRTDTGDTVAAVVGGTEARLVFPAHIGREPVVLHNAERIEAPRGTTVHYAIRPRVTAEKVSLQVAGRRVRLVPEASDRFRGRFVVRRGGSLHIRVQEPDGPWLVDPVRRAVRALEDHAPQVALREPKSDQTVEPDAQVPVAWEASDDVGLREVELVVRTPSGEDVRRSLSEGSADEPRRQAQGETRLAVAELGARPGDRLELWVEARDGDRVSGPNVGESAHRALVLASESTRRQKALAEIDSTLDAGLAALADRLELEVPDGTEAARGRFATVQESGQRFVEALRELAEQGPEGEAGGPRDGSVYRAMARRVERRLTRESRGHGRRLAAAKLRKRVDGRLVRELEKDVLHLADMLGQARLEDAAELTRELEALRREMTSLVSELRRADSPEARRALRAAISRARARMRELMSRIASMGENVPSDFLNADALAQAQEQSDALTSMDEALERGDLASVEEHLMELEHQIGSLAEALGSAESSYAQAQFGPRKKAMAEAMDALVGLETEQRKLAGQSDDVRRDAAEQALRASPALEEGRAEELAEQARGVRRSLRDVPKERLGAAEDEARMRAEQRLRDSADALRSGDVGEARRMANEAVRDLEGLARDLELSALMFPGRDGRTGDAARSAGDAAREARGLRDAIEKAIPRMGDFLGSDARKRMRADAARQGEVGEAAERLSERFMQGPDGQPLSPEAAESMREVHDVMREAHEQLGEQDPVGATRAQEEAARKLGKLRDELENHQRSSGGGGGGGGGDGGGGNGQPDMRRKVRIPGSGDEGGPMALRRKLLDAMREGAPPQHQDTVRRYYEGLLK